MLSKKLSFTLVLACINKGTAFNDEQFEQKENCNGRDTWLLQPMEMSLPVKLGSLSQNRTTVNFFRWGSMYQRATQAILCDLLGKL